MDPERAEEMNFHMAHIKMRCLLPLTLYPIMASFKIIDRDEYLMSEKMGSTGSRLSIKRSVAFITAGLLLFILYLHFFVGFGEILDILEQVNPVEYSLYYSLTFVALLLSILFYSMAWHMLLRVLSINISLRKALLYCLVGNFVDLIVPLETVSGELTRVYLAYRDLKDHLGGMVASVVNHRIISTLVTLSGLIISSVSLILSYKVNPYVLYLLVIVLIGTAAFIMILFYLSVKKEATERLINGLMKLAEIITRNRLKTADLGKKIQYNLSVFHQGFETFGKCPKYLMKSIVYAFASWFFHMTVYFLVFYALGREISITVAIIVYSISMAIQTIPVALPLGLVEIVMTSLYTLFGIPIAVSGTATALIRVVTFWFQIVVGYVIVQWMGIKNLLGRGV